MDKTNKTYFSKFAFLIQVNVARIKTRIPPGITLATTKSQIPETDKHGVGVLKFTWARHKTPRSS